MGVGADEDQEDRIIDKRFMAICAYLCTIVGVAVVHREPESWIGTIIVLSVLLAWNVGAVLLVLLPRDDKWSGAGLYDYGIALDLGWLNPGVAFPRNR